MLKRVGSAVSHVVRGLFDDLAGSVRYREVIFDVPDEKELVAKVQPGDYIRLKNFPNFFPSHDLSRAWKVEAVDRGAKRIVIEGHKTYNAEWFVLRVYRLERILKKLTSGDVTLQKDLIGRWLCGRVKDIVDNHFKELRAAQDGLKAARKVLQYAEALAEDELDRLNEVKKWSGPVGELHDLGARLCALIANGVIASYALPEEAGVQVLSVFTGVLEWKTGGIIKSAEYVIKIYPESAPLRIVVQNCTPNTSADSVPHSENITGVCNICFGNDQTALLKQWIVDEEWSRVIIMITAFLAGNRVGAEEVN